MPITNNARCACGGKTKVVRVLSWDLHAPRPYVVRERRCLDCNRRSDTIEIPISDLNLEENAVEVKA